MRALVITAMGRPSAQAASQNPRPERDAPSFCDPWRKAHPRFRLRVGCRFRIGLSRKLRPRIRPQNGTCFPDCPSSGNYIPDSGSKPGCAFPVGPLAETTSRIRRSEWDAVSDRGMERKTRSGILGRYCRMKLIIRTLSFASNAAWMPRMVTSPPHSTGRNTCR